MLDCRSRTIATVFAVTLAFSATSALAEAEDPVISVSCAELSSMPPRETLDYLMRFQGELFGKDVLEWRLTDFSLLSSAISECAAEGFGRNRSWWNAWANGTDKAAEYALPILLSSQEHEKWGEKQVTERIVLPNCLSLLNWTMDPVSLTDASQEIFSVDFKDMSIRDAQLAMDFSAGCQAHLPAIAAGRFDVSPAVTEAVVESLIETAFRTASARAEELVSPARIGDVSVEVDGRPALLGLAGDRVKSYVQLVKDALAKGPLSNDQIETFNREGTALLEEGQNAHGVAYIEGAKAALRREMFGN